MLELVRQLWSLLNHRERGHLVILALGLIARAGLEVVGVFSIMPFMGVAANPDLVQSNAYLSWAYDALAFTSVTAFVTVLGVAVVLLLGVRNGVSAAAVYGMLRFSWGLHHRLCQRLLKGYLNQPYPFFVQRNSASLNKTLLIEAQHVVKGVIKPALDVVARLLTIAALIGLLVFIDPAFALVAAAVLSGSYGGIYMLIKKKQRRLGVQKVEANRERFKVSGEAFGGIKDVKVLQREQEFAERFRPASWQYSKATASNLIMGQMPRYLIETIAFGGIVLIILFYLQQEAGLAQILPVISLYAFAGTRLIPELQAMFADVALIRFNRAALDDLLEDHHGWSEAPRYVKSEPLPFVRDITFEDVTFQYPEAAAPAVDAASLRIERNRTVGLVGASGSGKTTLVDLLLGLFSPDDGRILIDDMPLNESTLSAWRRQVGYVPQHIFLTDDSIAANIAFGMPEEEIDHGAVERAARVANLHDFIATLPGGYGTVVGERGVRLSGGQRQRIGIARALYHDPAVLVMDEATSALDGATENAVMEAIHELAGQKTIILIAHRLRTVQDCDLIYLLEQGRVQDCGTYGELAVGSGAFRAMAKLGAVTPL